MAIAPAATTINPAIIIMNPIVLQWIDAAYGLKATIVPTAEITSPNNYKKLKNISLYPYFLTKFIPDDIIVHP